MNNAQRTFKKVHQAREKIKDFLRNGRNRYITSYQATMLDKLDDDMKHEPMKFMKVTGSKENPSVKASILRDYQDEKKGQKFQTALNNYDETKDQFKLKRNAIDSMKDIQKCRDYQELKYKIEEENLPWRQQNKKIGNNASVDPNDRYSNPVNFMRRKKAIKDGKFLSTKARPLHRDSVVLD